ncbi:hypothetical protein R3P38DRAFT_3241851 [Favolaschia claudopus]|uniref:Uncharacterized protein n=1 Tax=Favolaschia claudopus TaxID=2862362 RepID=A0AAV9Z5S2_9AGAR
MTHPDLLLLPKRLPALPLHLHLSSSKPLCLLHITSTLPHHPTFPSRRSLDLTRCRRRHIPRGSVSMKIKSHYQRACRAYRSFRLRHKQGMRVYAAAAAESDAPMQARDVNVANKQLVDHERNGERVSVRERNKDIESAVPVPTERSEARKPLTSLPPSLPHPHRPDTWLRRRRNTGIMISPPAEATRALLSLLTHSRLSPRHNAHPKHALANVEDPPQWQATTSLWPRPQA